MSESILTRAIESSSGSLSLAQKTFNFTAPQSSATSVGMYGTTLYSYSYDYGDLHDDVKNGPFLCKVIIPAVNATITATSSEGSAAPTLTISAFGYSAISTADDTFIDYNGSTTLRIASYSSTSIPNSFGISVSTGKIGYSGWKYSITVPTFTVSVIAYYLL